MPFSLLDELQSGARFRNYTLIEKIGAGGQGVVWAAQDEQERVVAIKLYELLPDDTEQADDSAFIHQAEQIRGLAHPFVLPTLDIGLEGTLRYLVSPYIPGDTLYELVRGNQLTREEVLRYAAAIAAALDFLHAQGVIHRDLKPGNVLLDLHGGIYIADFGLARMVSQFTRAMHTGRGTPPYSPPEQHAHGEITPQSDIFSFGVILYELFTRHLPWDGERSLGLELLYDRKTQMPDPREYDPSLPAGLAEVLRQMTDLTPQNRLKTAGEGFRRVCAALGCDAEELNRELAGIFYSPEVDARAITKHCLQYWEPDLGVPSLTLTRFVFAEREYRRGPLEQISPQERRFFLQHAILHGWQGDFWWKANKRGVRLTCAAILINDGDEDTGARVLSYLHGDRSLQPLPIFPERLADSVLRLALKSGDPFIRQECLDVLELILPAGEHWKPSALGGELDAVLAKLAVEESPQRLQAARLIGRLRDQGAVEAIQRRTPAALLPKLLEPVMKSAGSLPASVPLETRLALQGNQFTGHLLVRPGQLLNALLLSFIGAALGFGGLVFVNYRLMEFMDATRILVSIERGLFLGILFALGSVCARGAVERLPGLPKGLTVLLGGLLGGAVFLFDFYIYSLLFLNAIPSGWVMAAGCLLMGLGFAAAGLARSPLLRALPALLGLGAALSGAWLLHAWAINSGVFLSPLISYEYTWSTARVVGVSFAGAFFPAVLGSLARLSVRADEKPL